MTMANTNFIFLLLVLIFFFDLYYCKKMEEKHPWQDSFSKPIVKPISNFHFAILSNIWERNNDPDFLLPFHQCIASIKEQNFKNWTLILIGDGLNNNNFNIVNNKLKSVLPPNKFIFKNMDKSKRVANYLKGKDLHGLTLWHSSGTSAVNEGFDIAYNLSFVTHIARLDDDDILMRAYQISDNVGFVFTTTNKTNEFRIQMKTTKIKTRNFTTGSFFRQPPIPASVGHSSYSMDAKIPEIRSLRYRFPDEQFTSNRSSNTICLYPGYRNIPGSNHKRIKCHQGVVMANDADFYERVYQLVIDYKKFESIFVQKESVSYLDQWQKVPLIEELYGKMKNN